MKQRITEMKSWRLLILGLSVLLVGSGCQHAASPSLEMQQKFFSSLKNSNPEEERAWRCAHYYQLAGRFDLALKELSTAVASDPENVRLLNAMGSCYDRLGEHARAKVIYERVLAQEASNTPARNNLGYSYYLSGDLARAEKIFQEVLARDPKNTVAQNNLGLVWCRQGNENKALSLWQKTDGDVQAREKLDQVLAYLGKPGEKTATGSSEDKGKTPQIPLSRDDLEDKPEKIARTPKNSAITRPLPPVADDPAPAPVKTSKLTRTPAQFPLEPQVTVEEVKMVIQPASYSPSPTAMHSPVPAVLPSNLRAGKPAPGRATQGKERRLETDLSQIEADEPGNQQNYPRPKQWKRYWKPKMVTYAPQESKKPDKPMKDYITKGYSHRNQSKSNGSGPEAAIY